MRKLTPEEIKEMNERTINESEEEYTEFIKDYKIGICYLCQKRYDAFVLSNPCMHWLLRPAGLDKKHLSQVFDNFDYFRIYALLCWLANTEDPMRNVNNLREEKSEKKALELTIVYKNLEWSFSSANSCFNGNHKKDGLPSGKPHYHFQMKIDGRIFVKYSDFHIPFTEYDLWCFSIQRGENEQVKYITWRGSIQDAFDAIPPEAILEGMKATDDESKATFRMQVMIEPVEGKTISGNEIADLIKERNRTGEPLAKLVKRLKNVNIKTVIMPGPAIPEIVGRRGGRGSTKK